MAQFENPDGSTLADFRRRQADRMSAAQRARARGDCGRCGHVARTKETGRQAQCDWAERHRK